VLVAAAVRAQGAAGNDSRYRREPLTPTDRAIVVCALLSVALFVGMRILDAGDVSYLSFPRVSMPAFHPAGIVATLLLLSPAVALLRLPKDVPEP
jgi:hypothetical protein